MGKLIHYSSLLSIITILLISLIPQKEYSWGTEDIALTYAVPTVIVFAIMTLQTKRTEFPICRIHIILILWYIYYTAYAYVDSSYPASQSISRITFLLVIFFSTSCILKHNKQHIGNISYLILGICVAECLVGVYQLFNGQSRNNLYPVTGTLLNPGPYGILLSCGLILFIDESRRQEFKRFSGLFTFTQSIIIILFAYMIITTGSRTSIIAFFACTAYIFRQYVKNHLRIIFPCFLVFICFLYFYKLESANGRLAMYMISIYNITQHPVFGSGIGSFLHQHAIGSAELSHSMSTPIFFYNDVITAPFNLPLFIGVEQGAIGILFLISTIAVTIKPLRRCLYSIKHLIPLLAISALFSYTFEILTFQLFAAFSLAVISLDDKPVMVTNKKTTTLVLSLCFILTASSLFKFRKFINSPFLVRKSV